MIINEHKRIMLFDTNFINRKATDADYCYANLNIKEICCSFDDNWDKEATYFNIVKEDGFYRMYYVALNRVDDEGSLVDLSARAHLAAIESKDGITWVKPNYGLVDFNGSKNNNLLVLDVFDNAFIYKDENPDCKFEEKYKALYLSFIDGKTYLKCSFSSDGLIFGEGKTICTKGTFDSLNVVFFDKRIKKYVCYFRNFHNIDGTDFVGFQDILNAENKAIRDVRVMYSDDFVSWTEPKRIVFDNDKDQQLYTNNIIPYYRAENYYIGFPERYIERQVWDENYDNLCSKKIRKNDMEIHPRLGLALTDELFISSNDGINFNMSEEPILFPGLERNGGWIYGQEKMCYGLIETIDAFGENKEISMYFPFANPKRAGTNLMRCALRLDGFVYYTAKDKEKRVVSNEFICEFNRLYCNMSTSADGYVKAIIKSEGGREIESMAIFGDSHNKEIIFKDDVSVLFGKKIIVELRLKEAKVYSIYFE